MKRTKKIKVREYKPFPKELVSSFAECVKSKWNDELYQIFEAERNKYLGDLKNDKLEQVKLVVELSRLSPTKHSGHTRKNNEKTKEKEENKEKELGSNSGTLQTERADEECEEGRIIETLPEVETKEA